MNGFSDDELLAKTAELTMLFDFYGALLAEKQRTYLVLHLQEDWTLTEIADDHGVSRQAVYDQVKRAEQLLAGYEEKLQLLHKHQQRLELYDQLQRASADELPLKIGPWLEQLRQWD